MEAKYSREPFEGYTHRFKVEFEIGDPYCTQNIDIYTNCDDKDKLEYMINEKKSQMVISFKIVRKTSKEQDDKTSELLDDILYRF